MHRPHLPFAATVATALIALSILASACGGATTEQLRARAAFDFKCPQDQVSVVELDARSRGATGCGQRATYVEDCALTTASGKEGCTWVLNSDSRPAK